jgi:hypothetical protein
MVKNFNQIKRSVETIIPAVAAIGALAVPAAAEGRPTGHERAVADFNESAAYETDQFNDYGDIQAYNGTIIDVQSPKTGGVAAPRQNENGGMGLTPGESHYLYHGNERTILIPRKKGAKINDPREILDSSKVAYGHMVNTKGAGLKIVVDGWFNKNTQIVPNESVFTQGEDLILSVHTKHNGKGELPKAGSPVWTGSGDSEKKLLDPKTGTATKAYKLGYTWNTNDVSKAFKVEQQHGDAWPGEPLRSDKG